MADTNDKDVILPDMTIGDEINLFKVNPVQHFTEPPPRYNDASLVKTLEEMGIGRPSTYAPIIETILARGYVQRISKSFQPTELGDIVVDMLKEYFKDIVDVKIDGQAVLDAVGLNNHANQFPAQLSGGEQQRVSIARAVAKQPTMLLCDDPTGALDSKTGVLILSLLQDMSNNRDTTVVIVTHNAILAEAADKVVRIKNGQIESIVVNEYPKKVSDLEW